jgi:pyridinium-3,5-biscarboxylic acid mononucleotide sulfurtransferase
MSSLINLLMVKKMDRYLATQKKNTLVNNLKGLPSLMVAFSGGVDSTYLLAVAAETLGSNLLAVTATSPVHPVSDIKNAQEFTGAHGITHILFESDERNIPEFMANMPDRCYHCKKALCMRLREIAKEHGISHIAHAINVDDLSDYRPGIKAASEMGLIAPLVDAELTKEEIRFLSKEMGLLTWDMPSMACLASRIPYGEPITDEKISMIQKAENVLAEAGLKQYRVRHHGTVARIEVNMDDFSMFSSQTFRHKIIKDFKVIGFLHITLDLEGYRSGSMNIGL